MMAAGIDFEDLFLETGDDPLLREPPTKEKANRPTKRGDRLVAFPWAFLADVCRLTHGRAAVVVAAHIYRRTCVCHNRTVTLPGAESAELGLNRSTKTRALEQLATAGLIRIERLPTGCSTKVTLLWELG